MTGEEIKNYGFTSISPGVASGALYRAGFTISDQTRGLVHKDHISLCAYPEAVSESQGRTAGYATQITIESWPDVGIPLPVLRDVREQIPDVAFLDQEGGKIEIDQE
ncbi:hypothetical protein ACFLQN_03725 [Candidatus Aenigmatarchaeota archaeon]